MSYTSNINSVLEKINLSDNVVLTNKITEAIDSINSDSSDAKIEFIFGVDGNVNLLSNDNIISKNDRIACSRLINKNNYRVFYVLNSTTNGGYVIDFYWQWCGTN